MISSSQRNIFMICCINDQISIIANYSWTERNIKYLAEKSMFDYCKLFFIYKFKLSILLLMDYSDGVINTFADINDTIKPGMKIILFLSINIQTNLNNTRTIYIYI